MLGYMAQASKVADIIKFTNQLTLDRESILDYPGGLGVITNSLSMRETEKHSPREM